MRKRDLLNIVSIMSVVAILGVIIICGIKSQLNNKSENTSNNKAEEINVISTQQVNNNDTVDKVSEVEATYKTVNLSIKMNIDMKVIHIIYGHVQMVQKLQF